MSQNFYFDGENISFIGWDKATQSAFLTLGRLDESGKDWDEPPLLCNDFSFDRVNNIQYIDEIVIAMKSRLEYYGIAIPDSMFEQLIKDISSNSVNVTRIHHEGAAPEIYSGDPIFNGKFSNVKEEI